MDKLQMLSLLYPMTLYLLVTSTTGLEWNYFGANDQWTWGQIAPVCSAGKRQSPIDIVGKETTYDDTLDEPKFAYSKNDSDYIKVYNDGKKVGTSLHGNLLVEGAGLSGKYRVYGAHWHWGRQDYKGSEHLYSGRAFPLELHLVAYSTRYNDLTEAVTSGDGDALTVFGTVYQIDDDAQDELLNKILTIFQQIKNPDPTNKIEIEAFDLSDLLSPDRTKYFRYSGSLTTPGCQEKVIWTNFVIPRKISKDQVAKFRTISAKADSFFAMGDNYREVQPLNGRTVQRSFRDIYQPAKCDFDVTVAGSRATVPSALFHVSSIIALYTIINI